MAVSNMVLAVGCALLLAMAGAANSQTVALPQLVAVQIEAVGFGIDTTAMKYNEKATIQFEVKNYDGTKENGLLSKDKQKRVNIQLAVKETVDGVDSFVAVPCRVSAAQYIPCKCDGSVESLEIDFPLVRTAHPPSRPPTRHGQ